MSHISGTGPVDPSDRKKYQQEYKHGAELFQKALDQYSKSTNPNQQAEFKDVMDKSLNVLQQSARGLMKKELETQNEKIAKDYETFQKYPGDQDTINKLNSDLDSAKNSVD